MTTWYIDAVSGNDSTGTGATGAPYKTIGKGLSVAANGDTLKLRTGTYRETNSTALSGLTISADTGHTPILVQSQTILYTAWTKTGGRTNVYQVPDTSGQTWGVWNGGTLLAPVASIAAVDAQTNSQFLDTAGHILYVNIGGGAPAAINSEDGNATATLLLSGGACAVNNLTFQWTLVGLALAGGNNYSINNCTCQYLAGPYPSAYGGIDVRAGVGHVIYGSTFRVSDKIHDIGIIVTGAASLTVSNCTFDNLIQGISLVAAATLTATDCTFSNMGVGSGANQGNGIQAENGAIYTVNAVRCTFIDCAHAGIVIDTVGSVLNAQFCLAYLTRDVNDRAYGFVIDAGGGSFYHCTVANLSRSSFAGVQYAFTRAGGAGAISIKNCIVYNCGQDFFNFGSGTQTFTEDYNLSFGTAHGGDWGPGAHDLTSDPLFVNSAGNDYHLQATSPARNAGIAIAGVNDAPLVQPPDLGSYDRTYVTPPGLPGTLGGTITLLDTVNPPVKGYKGPTWPSMKRTTKTAGAAHVNPAGVVKVDVGFVGGKREFPSLEFWELTVAQRDALIADVMANVVLYLVLPDQPGVYTCVFVGSAEDTADMHGDGTVVYSVKLTGLKVK